MGWQDDPIVGQAPAQPPVRSAAPAFRGLLQQGNIDLNNRPIVRNADGSISTVRSMSAEFDGREVLIPTVSDDGRILSDDEAIRLYQTTGRHLGIFDTPDNATAYAESLHNSQATQYGGSQPNQPSAADFDYRWGQMQNQDLQNRAALNRSEPTLARHLAVNADLTRQGIPTGAVYPGPGPRAPAAPPPAVINSGAFSRYFPPAGSPGREDRLAGVPLTGEVRAPEGGWQSDPVVAAASPLEMDTTTSEAFLRGASQGFTLGWGDEATAFLNINPLEGDWGGQYRRELDEQRGELDLARQEHPVATMVGEVAGSVAPALVPVGAGISAARGVGGLAGLGLGVATGTVAGGVQGAVYGAGTATEGQRTQGAVLPGAFGAVAGGAMPVIGPLVSAVLRPAVGAVVERMSARFGGNTARGASGAERQVGEALSADAATPQAVQQLGPEGMVLDAGPNSRQLAETIAQVPGKGQTIVRGAIAQRGQGATNRVRTALDKSVGPPVNIPVAVERLMKQRAAAAAPMYQAAYAFPINAGAQPFQKVLASPAGRSALRHAQELAANEGDDAAFQAARAGQPFDISQLTTREFDYIQRALQEQATSVVAKQPQMAAAIGRQREALLRELDRQNPDFAAARANYAGDSAVLDAVENGQSVFNRTVSPDQLRAELQAMTPTERFAFASGARAQIEEIMGTARSDAAGALALAQRGWNQEKLAIIIGATEAKRLLSALNAEKVFNIAHQAITDNSATARRLFGAKNVPGTGAQGAAGAALTGATVGGPGGAITGLLAYGGAKAISSFFRNMSEEEAARATEEMARLLVNQGPAAEQTIQRLLTIAKDAGANSELATRISAILGQAGAAGLQGGSIPALTAPEAGLFAR